MSQMGTVRIHAGSRVWWRGAAWEIEAVSAKEVMLRRADDVVCVDASALIGGALPLDETLSAVEEPPAALGAVALSQLPASVRRAVEAEARVLAGVPVDGVVSRQRAARAAQELGVDERTVRRRVAAYQRAGIAGLVDGRLAGGRSVNVDSRWDRTLLSVLKSYTNASTPSMLAVIDETNRQVVAAYGTDVALPARASAYRRVAALSKGRHTFGSAKSRRSVAKRPQGVLGRLRADRPGEYVVLDTNSLDVFAMAPVTGRWVPVQLTVAMDLFSRDARMPWVVWDLIRVGLISRSWPPRVRISPSWPTGMVTVCIRTRCAHTPAR